jgi:hypothetical protein
MIKDELAERRRTRSYANVLNDVERRIGAGNIRGRVMDLHLRCPIPASSDEVDDRLTMNSTPLINRMALSTVFTKHSQTP